MSSSLQKMLKSYIKKIYLKKNHNFAKKKFLFIPEKEFSDFRCADEPQWDSELGLGNPVN